MNIPTIKGMIRRRILLNYRVNPEVVAQILPSNFRPKIVKGYAIAGICLIRLEAVRPKGLPAFLGVSSENSAHRIAIEWEDAAGRIREGVFVPRRDSNSLLNSLAGGRIFPGVHHHSKFHIHDSDGQISVRVEVANADSSLIEIEAKESKEIPSSSVFDSLADSSRFFEAGCIGYSARPESQILDGLLLKVSNWRVSPLSVQCVKSSYFDNNFPLESIEFDHALLMRDILHEWHSEPSIMAEQ